MEYEECGQRIGKKLYWYKIYEFCTFAITLTKNIDSILHAKTMVVIHVLDYDSLSLN